MVAHSILLSSFVSLLVPVATASPALPDVVQLPEANTSAKIAPSNNVTLGAAPWPPAPFQWSQRGIAELLPRLQSLTITCTSYDARPFSSSETYAIQVIAQHYYSMLKVVDPMKAFPEEAIELDNVAPRLDIKVTVMNARDQPGRRHTNLSVAEALVAFVDQVTRTGTGHSATLVPKLRRIPLTNYVTYRAIRIYSSRY